MPKVRDTRHLRALQQEDAERKFEHFLGNTSRLAVILIAVLALLFTLHAGRAVLAPLALGVVIGLMFGPFADALERRGVPAFLSALAVVIAFFGAIGAGMLLFAAPLADWWSRVPAIWDKLRGELMNLQQPIQSLELLQEQIKAIFGTDTAMEVTVQGTGPVETAAQFAPWALAQIAIFLVSLYFFLATRHEIRIAVLSLCFSRRLRWQAAHVFRDVEVRVSRFLIAVSVINVLFGIVIATAMWALGVPSPMLWGALGAVLNFIPYLGQVTMFVVMLVVGLGTQSEFPAVIWPALVYGGINFIESQFITPHFVGRYITLNPFLFFLALTFWLWTWGPIGGLVAVPALLVLQSVLMHLLPIRRQVARHRARGRAADDPESGIGRSPGAPAAKPSAVDDQFRSHEAIR